jgi:hypothetical protein
MIKILSSTELNELEEDINLFLKGTLIKYKLYFSTSANNYQTTYSVLIEYDIT